MDLREVFVCLVSFLGMYWLSKQLLEAREFARNEKAGRLSAEKSASIERAGRLSAEESASIAEESVSIERAGRLSAEESVSIERKGRLSAEETARVAEEKLRYELSRIDWENVIEADRGLLTQLCAEYDVPFPQVTERFG